MVDERDAQASHDRAMALGESWMPEHYYGLGRPTGPVYAEAPSIAELLAAMRSMPWPTDW